MYYFFVLANKKPLIVSQVHGVKTLYCSVASNAIVCAKWGLLGLQ